MKNIREKNPEIVNKIVGVPGDLSTSGLGIDERTQLEIEKRCSIVFHIAASVRFDDTLKKAFLTNIKGTLEVIKFCETWANLEVSFGSIILFVLLISASSRQKISYKK